MVVATTVARNDHKVPSAKRILEKILGLLQMRLDQKKET
jgi:hypothetical protein